MFGNVTVCVMYWPKKVFVGNFSVCVFCTGPIKVYVGNVSVCVCDVLAL